MLLVVLVVGACLLVADVAFHSFNQANTKSSLYQCRKLFIPVSVSLLCPLSLSLSLSFSLSLSNTRTHARTHAHSYSSIYTACHQRITPFSNPCCMEPMQHDHSHSADHSLISHMQTPSHSTDHLCIHCHCHSHTLSYHYIYNNF